MNKYIEIQPEFNFDLYQIHPAESFFSIDKQSKSYSYFAAYTTTWEISDLTGLQQWYFSLIWNTFK